MDEMIDPGLMDMTHGKHDEHTLAQFQDPAHESLAFIASGALDEEDKQFDTSAVEYNLEALADSVVNPDNETPGPSSGKKKKNVGEDGKIKRTRQSQSCDACRARKVKCNRDAKSESKEACSHCKQLGLECTFDYVPKKRGPPNMYIKRMQQGEQGLDSPQTPNSRRDIPSSSSFQSPNTPYQTYLHPPPEEYVPPQSHGGTLSSQNAYGGSALAFPGQGQNATMGKHINTLWDESLTRAINATAPKLDTPITNFEANPKYKSSPLGPSATSTSPLTNQNKGNSPAFSPSAYTALIQPYPHNPNNPLDQILPRGLLLHIVDLYFDYVYPLIPAVHKPSFMRDLENHREESQGQEEWTHMVLAVVASTLVQVPRAFVPLPRKEVRMLAERGCALVRSFLAKDFDGISVQRMTTLYLIALSTHLLGQTCAGMYLFGANAGTLTRMRYNEEATYNGMPTIERELKKRLFWLAYGGDRSITAIDGTAMFFAEDDCADLGFPAEVDDEYITEEGFLEQPGDKASLITGFNYISKIFRICGQVTDRRRRDRRSPPSGVALQMRINEVNELYEQIMSIMDGCPEALKLDLESDSRSIANFSDDWDAHASADIRSLFLDPKASKAVVKDAFLVQQANIYVTQQMVRYQTLQYRDELLSLQQSENSKAIGQISAAKNGNNRRTSNTRKDWGRAMFSEEEKDQVATDLLTILQKIPIQVIAVNSLPLVVKVRFVASTLLDALANPAPAPANPSPEQARAAARTQKAQTYLWDFLRILSEIENLYSMTDDDSNVPIVS